MKTVQEIENSKRRSPLEVFFFILFVLLIAMLVSALSSTAYAQDNNSEGEAVFTQVCSSCHSLQPTSTGEMPLAPPMAMISKRYIKMTGSEDAARAAILSWLVEPDTAKSLMPAHAIEHHGLMPPIPLSEDQRLAVADFVLGLSDGMEHSGMAMGGGGMKEKSEGKGGHGMHGMNKKDAGGEQTMSGMKGNMECSMHSTSDSTSTASMKGCKGMKGMNGGECKVKSGAGKMGSGNGHSHGKKEAAQDSTATGMSECKMMNHKKN